MSKIILVTGCAGFIGFHLSNKLLKDGFNVLGVDNLNDYYDLKIKFARLKELEKTSNFLNKSYWQFHKGDLTNNDFLEKIFKKFKPEIVFHMAAQAGVRYSLINPQAYIRSNLLGFSNIIECSRNFKVKNFIFASSSSVYGGNEKLPFSEKDSVNHPVSLYAATKKSNELIAHSYSHLYSMPIIGLRFFTVYGPWGRPDMAPFIFADSIFKKKPIKVFNYGKMSRDFTYIDDVIQTMIKLIDKPAAINNNFNKENPDPSSSWSPYRIFNVGNSKKTKLLDFICELENHIGIKAIMHFEKMQKGDIKSTFSDSKTLEDWTGFRPNTSIKYGIKKFVEWYKSYYK